MTVLILAVTLLSGGCSTLDYDIQVNRDPAMRRYATWAWHPRGNRVALVEPRRANDAHQRITAAIEAQLAAKQVRKAPAGEAEVFVAFDMGSVPRTQVTEWAEGKFQGRDTSVAMATRQYRQGSLVVYLVESRGNRLVWRGVAEATVENPDDAAAKVDEIVAKLFAQYP